MSSSSLAQTWNLDFSARETSARYNANPTPSTADSSNFIDNFLLNRWAINYISIGLFSIPLSYIRLRNDTLLPLFNNTVALHETLQRTADQRKIPLPLIPDPAQDWEQEAQQDIEELYSVIAVHLSQPALNIMANMKRFSTEEGRKHWTTKLSQLALATEAHFAPLMQGLEGEEEMRRCSRVLNEEVLQIRSEPGESGWDEEEAKKAAGVQLGLLREFWMAAAE